ncbi:TauD/TfdA family dioxygenase [Streptomyces viridochromogenes]|uniref:TauD/TfdA family dioxygenase n=1 Tax=Streptomyces viridochromogenes TaxID=1938 RepID=UPI0001B4E879|nr:TauD/TfdA family dioxygenase [Streptomyces viridochromogenes]
MSAGPDIVRYALDDGVRDVLAKELDDRLADAHLLDPDTDGAILATVGASALRQHLPCELVAELGGFRARQGSVLVLQNLPRHDAPPTPVGGFTPEAALAPVNALHLGLVRLLEATPFAVPYENRGRLMRNVVPNPAATGTTSSWGSDAEFFWHTDNPHLPFGEPGHDPRPYVPRHLAFLALRNSERVPTDVVGVDPVLARLAPAVREALTRPEFEIGAPASIKLGAPPPVRGAVLEHSGATARLRYDHGTTRGLTARAAAALDELAEALSGADAEQFVLRPGDFLFFDNYRVLHRRRAFTPGPKAGARWLRRCYAS